MLKIVKKFFFTLTLRQGVFLIRGEEHGVHSAKTRSNGGSEYQNAALLR